jgi:hypothetical protein
MQQCCKLTARATHYFANHYLGALGGGSSFLLVDTFTAWRYSPLCKLASQLADHEPQILILYPLLVGTIDQDTCADICNYPDHSNPRPTATNVSAQGLMSVPASVAMHG